MYSPIASRADSCAAVRGAVRGPDPVVGAVRRERGGRRAGATATVWIGNLVRGCFPEAFPKPALAQVTIPAPIELPADAADPAALVALAFTAPQFGALGAPP